MRSQIWNGILDTERLSRYFQRLEDKLRWRYQLLTVLLAVSASGAMGSLLSEMPYAISAAVMFLAACLSIWLYHADYSGKATAAGLFSAQYKALAIEWEQLWYGEPAQAEVHSMQVREARVSNGYHIPVNDALNKQCTGEAYEVLPQKFATARG